MNKSNQIIYIAQFQLLSIYFVEIGGGVQMSATTFKAAEDEEGERVT